MSWIVVVLVGLVSVLALLLASRLSQQALDKAESNLAAPSPRDAAVSRSHVVADVGAFVSVLAKGIEARAKEYGDDAASIVDTFIGVLERKVRDEAMAFRSSLAAEIDAWVAASSFLARSFDMDGCAKTFLEQQAWPKLLEHANHFVESQTRNLRKSIEERVPVPLQDCIQSTGNVARNRYPTDYERLTAGGGTVLGWLASAFSAPSCPMHEEPSTKEQLENVLKLRIDEIVSSRFGASPLDDMAGFFAQVLGPKAPPPKGEAPSVLDLLLDMAHTSEKNVLEKIRHQSAELLTQLDRRKTDILVQVGGISGSPDIFMEARAP